MGTVISIVMLLIVSIIILSPQEPGGVKSSRGPTDPPIRIDSDTDLESQAVANGWPGSGTEIDPYIIGNYTIDGSGQGCCIYVGNTTKHFVIRNCTVFNASYPYPFYAGSNSKYYGENGINFWDVENATLDNVSSSNNLGYGAWLHLDNGLILNSSFHENNMSGLWIAGSNCNISNNEFHNNSFEGVNVNGMVDGVFSNNSILFNGDDGLFMGYMTESNQITDNHFRGNEGFDIVFSASIDNQLRRNDMTKGFNIQNDRKESWLTFDIDDSNLLNGIPIRVYRNVMPSEIDLASPMIYFVNISGIDLDDYEAEGPISSLRLIFCNEVTIDGSTFYGSAGEGLYTYYCQNVSIRNCTSYDNNVGFFVLGAFSVLVENCTAHDNNEDGISVGVNGVHDSMIVRNNHAHGNGGSGLYLSQSSMNATCKVVGNVIEDNNGGLMYSSLKGGYSQDSPGTDIIQDNIIRNNPRSGLSLSLKHSHYLTRMEGNHIAGNGAGISIRDSSGGGTIIEDNKVLKNNGTGIFGVLSNSYVNVSGEPISCGIFDNTIEGNDGYGVFFVSSSKGGIHLVNNVISNSTRSGVMFSAMSNGGTNRIVGNRIEVNGGVGIEMGSQSNGDWQIKGINPISDNIIRYNKGWNGDYNEDRDETQMIGGILIESDSSSGYPVRNNTITDNNGTGIHFVSSKSGSGNISGNDISRNLGDGVNIFVSRAGDRRIIDNRITGNRDSGIEFGLGIDGYDVFDNTISGNREGIFLNGCNRTSIGRNIFTGNGIGILSRGGDNATVSTNLFSDNTDYGIKIETGNMSRIWNNSFFRNNGASSAYDEGHRQACDNGTGNIWYDDERGNYWDDWRNASAIPIRTDPYPLACGAGSEDLHPLGISPFGPFEADLLIESPGEGSHLPDSTVVIDFTILTNGARIEAVEGSLDGGFWLIIGEDGQWTLTDLEEGPHTVTISILEVGGKIVERTVNFNVDLTDPEILDYSPVGDNVLVDSPIVVEFSEEMQQYGNEFDFAIIGNVSIEDNIATFSPTYPMEENTEYEVGVLGRDLSGRTVEFNWTFTTTGASYRVFGRVVDEDGKVLEEVNVVISYLGNQSEIFNEITSGSGNFEARAEPGSYRITLTKEGYEDLEMEFNITDNFKDLGNIEMEEVEEDADGMNICLIGGIASVIILAIILLIIFLISLKEKEEEIEE